MLLIDDNVWRLWYTGAYCSEIASHKLRLEVSHIAITLWHCRRVYYPVPTKHLVQHGIIGPRKWLGSSEVLRTSWSRCNKWPDITALKQGRRDNSLMRFDMPRGNKPVLNGEKVGGTGPVIGPPGDTMDCGGKLMIDKHCCYPGLFELKPLCT